MIWGQNLEHEPSTGLGRDMGKWSSCSCWDSVIPEGTTRSLDNVAINHSPGRWPASVVSIHVEKGTLLTDHSLIPTYGILLAFTLPMKNQTPGGCGTCSLYPGTEIGFKPKSVYHEGLCWSTILYYPHRVYFGAFRTQKCCIEQQGSLRNSESQSECQHQEGLSVANRTTIYEKMVRGKKSKELGFPGGAVVENLPANAGDTGSSPGLGRSHILRSN